MFPTLLLKLLIYLNNAGHRPLQSLRGAEQLYVTDITNERALIPISFPVKYATIRINKSMRIRPITCHLPLLSKNVVIILSLLSNSPSLKRLISNITLNYQELHTIDKFKLKLKTR